MDLCVFRFPEEEPCNWQTAWGEYEWPVPHLQWPALAHAVGTGGCNCVYVSVCICVCVHWAYLEVSLSFSLSPLSSCPHGDGCSFDRHKSGRLSCVTGERERSWREAGRLWRERREETRWSGVVHVKLRQMSGIDEAWSNTDTQLGCNNKTSSSLQQRLVLSAWPTCLWRPTGAQACCILAAKCDIYLL